jgi:hypothetical protein
MSNVGRIPDDRVEFFGNGVRHEIHNLGIRRCHRGVKLNRDTAGQVSTKCSIASRWLKSSPGVSAQRQHLLHNIFSRKNLAEFFNSIR